MSAWSPSREETERTDKQATRCVRVRQPLVSSVLSNEVLVVVCNGVTM